MGRLRKQNGRYSPRQVPLTASAPNFSGVCRPAIIPTTLKPTCGREVIICSLLIPVMFHHQYSTPVGIRSSGDSQVALFDILSCIAELLVHCVSRNGVSPDRSFQGGDIVSPAGKRVLALGVNPAHIVLERAVETVCRHYGLWRHIKKKAEYTKNVFAARGIK